MGIPNWALGLGALLKAPEAIGDGLSLFRSIRDDRAAQANNQAARDTVDNLAWAAQEEDPAVRLENFREVSRDMTTRPVNADTALKLQSEISAQTKGTLADVKAAEQQSQLAVFQKEAADAGTDLLSYGMQHPDRIPLGALQGVHSALSVFAKGAESEISRRSKEQAEQEKQANIAGFQGAIAGLVAPSKSPVDLKRFASNGGYAPISEVESDIRQAAQAYNVGDSDEVGKAVTDARMTYKDTYLPTESGKVSRTSFTGQRNLLGDFRKDAQSVAPVTKITVNQGAKEKDLPTGIQERLQSKLEIYNDWNSLKETFRPEYMPRTPVKSIGEMQINLNRIFGGNQAAIDWWTKYFDSRNLLIKDRSGAAVTEPEFKRFEQGSIAANVNPQTVINYLDRSVNKYRQHTDAYLNANRKNHPESVKAFEDAFGYRAPAKGGKETGARPIAPAGTQARVNGKILTSDGKGGWR